jgi:hypothetical protein
MSIPIAKARVLGCLLIKIHIKKNRMNLTIFLTQYDDISLEKHKNTCHFMVLIETQFLAKVQARK